MAFQPIVDADTHTVLACEALVRSENGEGAGEVIARVTPAALPIVDAAARAALELETA